MVKKFSSARSQHIFKQGQLLHYFVSVLDSDSEILKMFFFFLQKSHQ